MDKKPDPYFVAELAAVISKYADVNGEDAGKFAEHAARTVNMLYVASLLRRQPAIIDEAALHNTRLCFTPFLDLLPLPEGAEIPDKYFVNVALMTGVITALMAGEALGDALQHLDGQIGTLSLGMQSTVDNMLVPIRQRHWDARNLALTYEKMLMAEGFHG